MNFLTNGQQLDNCYPRNMSPRSWDVAYNVVPCDRQMVTKNQVQFKYVARRYHKRPVLPFISSIRYEIWEIVNSTFLRILKSTSNDDCDVINVWTDLISNGNTLWFYRNVNAISFKAITAKTHDEGRVHLLNLICWFWFRNKVGGLVN